MADWKDFYEDNKEFLGQYLDSLAERKGSKGNRDDSARTASSILPAVPCRFSLRTWR